MNANKKKSKKSAEDLATDTPVNTGARITSTHEDYLEAVFRLSGEDSKGIRVTDLAKELGCRLPTVTRTVKTLADLGFFSHESRGLVHLTDQGKILAREIAHRHDDVVSFLQFILGLSEEDARADACQLEHGLSALGAERLHRFLDYIDTMPVEDRKKMQKHVSADGKHIEQFGNLVEIKTQGWRG